MQWQDVCQDQDALRRQCFAGLFELRPARPHIGGHAEYEQVCVVVPGVQPGDVRGRNGGNLGRLLDVLEHLQQPEPEQWMLLDQQRVH
ncbi:hypothetical protein D3C86_1971140 [compost metagenome]